MYDQAEKLRLKLMKSQGALARSVAVVSGKGGVGKSNFSTNFSFALQSLGKKVLIIDMDIGMGNIHILLGMTPHFNLKDYLSGTKELNEVINTTDQGLSFIAGGSGLDSVMEWSVKMFERLLFAFQQLQKEYDVILFDMGAGATQSSLDLILSVDEIIVISTTEPTSITDAYSMMKFISLKDESKTFHIIGNRVTKQDEGTEAVARLQYAMKKFLHKETVILGYLPEDPAVHKAVIAQTPFLLHAPNAHISKRMMELAKTFVGIKQNVRTSDGEGFLGRIRKIFTKGLE